ncbi:MAG: RNA polymerase sigma factor [Blastocatellia bacterium]
MNEEDLNRFLAWLDPDRDKAALRYEEIRRNLIGILNRRSGPNPGELADKAFDRVINHLPKIIETYEGEPAKYIVRVAINLCHDERKRLENLEPLSDPNKKNSPRSSPREDDEKQERERLHQCLEACLGKLPEGKRDLILDYYAKKGKEKIENRQRVADYLGISLNALAIRVLRIRETLEACLLECLKDEKFAK